MRIGMVILGSVVLLGLQACGGGGGGGVDDPAPAQGSSSSSSGSTAVFTDNGATYAVTPGAAAGGGGGAGASVKLLTLPNTGTAVGVVTQTQVEAVDITTSLTGVSGTAIDPAHDVGLAYNYNEDMISFFRLSTRTETATHDLSSANMIDFSGGGGYVVGAVMNARNQIAIIATADGFEVIDYSNPSAPTKLREIASVAVAGADGVEINENFGFHPALSIGGASYDMILSGGKYYFDSNGNSLELVDANTGAIFRPDTATLALFTHEDYIDAISVDTNYHVAVMATEFSDQQMLVNLNQLTLNATDGTFTLPAAAVSVIATSGFEMTNIAVESEKHLVMMAAGFGGDTLLVAELENPSVALGFKRITSATVGMPADDDDQGNPVYWSGGLDPHGAGAYLTPSDHPTKPSTAMGLWVSECGDHIAIIDLEKVLSGQLAAAAVGGDYDPITAPLKDIVYFAVPGATSTCYLEM